MTLTIKQILRILARRPKARRGQQMREAMQRQWRLTDRSKARGGQQHSKIEFFRLAHKREEAEGEAEASCLCLCLCLFPFCVLVGKIRFLNAVVPLLLWTCQSISIVSALLLSSVVPFLLWACAPISTVFA